MHKLTAVLVLVFTAGCASQQQVAKRDPVTRPAPQITVKAKKEAPKVVEAPKPEVEKFTGAVLHFEFNESTLLEESRQELQRLADIMRADTQLRVEIAGHADERGTTEYNLALGNRRADAARAYLKTLGVPADRVTIISYGEEMPAVQGSSEDAYAANRRDVIEPK